MTEVFQLPVGNVEANPNNARKKLTGIDDLAKSIQSIGLIEPIVVRALTKTNKYVVIAGHRRLAAVKQLKQVTVSAIVVEMTKQFEALSSLTENTSREALTPEDLADAVGKLAGLEISDDEIIQSLSINQEDLERARVVAGASKATRKKAVDTAKNVERQLTLAEQAALIKYSDNPEDLQTIQWTIEEDPHQLDHTVARIEAERVFRADIKVLTDALGDTVVIKVDSWNGPDEGVEPLCNLTTKDGEKLTLKNHKTCVGHAASLENADRFTDKKPSVVFHCLAWKANGHVMIDKPVMTWNYRKTGTGSAAKSPGGKPVTAKEQEKATAERRATIANNKAWTPATVVRAKWIADFTKRKTINPAAKLWVLNEIVLDKSHLDSSAAGYGNAKAATTLDAAFVIVCGQIIRDREDTLTTAKWRPFSNDQPRLARYMKFIESQGYTLSDVEKILLKKK